MEQRPTKQNYEIPGPSKSVEEILRKYLYTSIFRQVFNYKQFNPMQTIVSGYVLQSNDNITVASPTGSGKTCIFELALVKMFSDDQNKLTSASTSIQNINPKAIYLAPSKSLVQEKIAMWKHKFGSLNKRIVELTSDSTETEGSDFMDSIIEADIICGTAEKFDSFTRKWRDNQQAKKLVLNLKLILLDEIHTVGDVKRGIALEAVITRIKLIKAELRDSTKGGEVYTSRHDPVSFCRMIALSATLPNIEDIGQWLQCKPTHIFSFGNLFRPVKLELKFCTYGNFYSRNDYLFDIHLPEKLHEVCKKYYQGRPALIFGGTRKGVVSAALRLIEDCDRMFVKSNQQQQRLRVASESIEDENLRRAIKFGVGFHHAGLSINDRRRVENLFIDCILQVVACTSTLAIGVNLPAHLVIVLNTKIYRGSYIAYGRNDLLQMIGRAGRPGFDTEGIAVIMTSEGQYDTFKDLEEGAATVESQLNKSLSESINSEIVLQSVNDIEACCTYLRNSFLAVRSRKSPHYYDMKDEHTDTQLEQIAMQTLKDLEAKQMCTFLADKTSVVTARYYLDVNTTFEFSKIAPGGTIVDILKALAKAAELVTLVRRDDKKSLNDIYHNQAKHFKAKRKSDRIQTVTDKNMILFEAEFGRLDFSSKNASKLKQDKFLLAREAPRVVKAMVQYYQHRSISSPLLVRIFNRNFINFYFNKQHTNKEQIQIKAIQVRKMLKCKLWNDTFCSDKACTTKTDKSEKKNSTKGRATINYLLTQLTRVGSKTAVKLCESGFDTFDKIKTADHGRLASICKKKADFVARMQAEAASVPVVEYVTVEQVLPLHKSLATIKVGVKLKEVDKTLHPGSFRMYISTFQKDGLLFQRKVQRKLAKGAHNERAKHENGDKEANTLEYQYVIEKEKCTTIPNTYGQSRISIQLVHENFVGHDIYQEKTILFQGHRQLTTKKKGGDDEVPKRTPKTSKKQPTHDSHKRKKKKREPVLLSEIHSKESRSSNKISGGNRTTSKAVLSNNNKTEGLFDDLPDSVFSNINVDSGIKEIKFKHPARGTFAQFAYGKTGDSQNDTYKDFAEPYSNAEGATNKLEMYPRKHSEGTTKSSWTDEQYASYDNNSIAAGQRHNKYINKPRKKPRTEIRNRNHTLTNEQVQLADGAYDASNDEIFHTEVANDFVFTNCNAGRGTVRNFRMQMPNGHGNYFPQVEISDGQQLLYPNYGHEQDQGYQAQMHGNTNDYQQLMHPVFSPPVHHDQNTHTAYSHGRLVKRISFEDAFS